MIVIVRGVHVDATTPPPGAVAKALEEQPLEWPEGEDGSIIVDVEDQSGDPADLTQAVMTLGVRRYKEDAAATIMRAGIITAPLSGRCQFDLTKSDTLNRPTARHLYDVQLTDATGKRWQVVPASPFVITPIIARPDETLTLPVTTPPYGLGPAWISREMGNEEITDGTTDEQIYDQEFNWDFDDVGALVNLFARVCGLASVSGGSGLLRVRYGGTPGVANSGTVLLTSDPITSTTPVLVSKSTMTARPTGIQLVRITMQQTVVSQTMTARAVTLVARASA